MPTTGAVADDKELDKETDPHRISQRQRQIDFGKNTIGYQRYLEQYPKYVCFVGGVVT